MSPSKIKGGEVSPLAPASSPQPVPERSRRAAAVSSATPLSGGAPRNAPEWTSLSFNQMGELNRGKSKHRPRNDPALYGGRYPFIQTGDIRASNGAITSHTQTYSELGFKQSRIWPAGTLAITIAANIAESATLTYPACFPDSVVGFIANPVVCDQQFVRYLFSKVKHDLQREHVGTGSVQDNINLEILGKIIFQVPALPIQKAIAHILGTLDDRIELCRRMNETLEAMARALFKDWFIDFGPVRAKMEGREPPGLSPEIAALFPSKLVDSELGEIPEGWTVQSLDQIANYLNGLALQKYPPLESDNLPVIKIAQLRKGETVGADLCGNNLPAEYIIKDGDVLFSWSGSLEVEIWCGGIGALNQHLFKVTSDTFPKWYYYLWTKHHLDDFRLIAAGKATTMGHIQRKHLTLAKALTPSQELIHAMHEVMSPIFEQVISSTTRSMELATFRDTLLPKLLSGELSIPEAMLHVEAMR